MNTFTITVSLVNNIPTSFIVIPNDNNENSYPTYFQLLAEGTPYTEIRLNDDLIWEVCKGYELDEVDIQLIMAQIEISLYGKSEAINANLENDKIEPLASINEIINTISNKQSAA
jgi:hypothetical protein